MTRTWVALLRGINVGGRNRLPMSELRSIFRQAGCPVARTYGQSGNVLFRSTEAEARRIGAVVGTALGERFGSPMAVVLRSGEEVAEAIAANPLLTPNRDTRHLHVCFLGSQPLPDRISALDPDPRRTNTRCVGEKSTSACRTVRGAPS